MYVCVFVCTISENIVWRPNVQLFYSNKLPNNILVKTFSTSLFGDIGFDKFLNKKYFFI